MSDEQSRAAAASSAREESAVDVPVARAPAVSAGEPTYSEQQVTELLQRAAQLERGRTQHKPQLSLAEVEGIAREAGLDPSLVRLAAQSLAQTKAERGLGARLLGAPTRRTIERVIDGELSVAEHERIGVALRAAVRAVTGYRFQAPQIASLGRSLLISANSGALEIELTPRDGKTVLRIEINHGGLAGGLYGGLMGGLGGGLTPLAFALAEQSHFGLGGLLLSVAGLWGGVYALARTIFTLSASSGHRKMEKLADALAAHVRDELTRRAGP